MITLYGIKKSRAARCLWMLEELGVNYTHVPTSFADGSKTEDYLKINPNGRIPALQDDELIVWESMAINLYLAKRYGMKSHMKSQAENQLDVGPRDLTEDALMTQWSFWIMTEVDGPLLNYLFHTVLFDKEKRVAEKAAQAASELQRPFAVLEKTLTTHPWLVGERFTVADLNVSAVLAWAKMSRYDLSDFPCLQAWLNTNLQRPAAIRAR